MAHDLVYLACADPREIHVLRLEDDGSLVPQSVSTVPGIDGPSPISMPIALSHDRRFLYAALREPPFPLASFSVDSWGDLTYIASYALPDSVPYLAVAPNNTALLAASGPLGLVFTIALDDAGIARGLIDQVGIEPRGHCAVFSPNGSFVYAASLGDDRVVRFRYDTQVGRLDDPAGVGLPDGSHPRHLLVSADGSFLYVVTEAHASVVVLSIDRDDGSPTVVDVVRTMPPDFNALAADLRLSNDGRFLFASERNGDLISTLRVADDGSLRVVAQATTEQWTRSFAIDPFDRFLLAPGQRSNQLTVFAIDRLSGALEGRHRYPTAGNPSWIEIRRHEAGQTRQSVR